MNDFEILGQSTLCRNKEQTCGACCWGVDVSRKQLQVQLQRQRDHFDRFEGRMPGRWEAILHEIRSRRGIDLIWAVLMRLPIIGRKVRQKVAPKLTCAFMGFDSFDQTTVGCMLHPTRFDGSDLRNELAFQLLPEVRCGDPQYVCNACDRFNAMTDIHKSVFETCVSDLDWFEYTKKVRSFSCASVVSAADRQLPDAA